MARRVSGASGAALGENGESRAHHAVDGGFRDAREMLGEDFVQHYVLMKRFEAEKYRQHVSAWEVRRYVEMA